MTKKAAITAYPELIMIIFALALGIMLFSIANNYGPKNQFTDTHIEGDPDFISEKLAVLAEECWKRNKKGKAPESDVCFTLEVDSDGIFNESLLNHYLDCEYLDNNYLDRELEPYDDCGKENDLYWEVYNTHCTVIISYSASRRRIEIKEENAPCIEGCCITKCTELYDDLVKDCDDARTRCTDGDPAIFYSHCKTTADTLLDGCKDNCYV
ncbi:MAG: hypothetical protein ABIG84_08375 [archaeon]